MILRCDTVPDAGLKHSRDTNISSAVIENELRDFGVIGISSSPDVMDTQIWDIAGVKNTKLGGFDKKDCVDNLAKTGTNALMAVRFRTCTG